MHTAFVMSLLSLIKFSEEWSSHQIIEGFQENAIDINVHFFSGSLLVASREELVKQALAWEADWLLWLDSDMTFSPDALVRLLMREKNIIGCNYVRRQVPTLPVTTDMNDMLYCTNPEDTGLVEIKHTGFGCLLVKSDVFKNIEEPWFDTQWVLSKETGKTMIMGEDVYFFRKARDIGEQVWLDNDLSQSTVHIGNFEFHNRLAKATVEDYNKSGIELQYVNSSHPQE